MPLNRIALSVRHKRDEAEVRNPLDIGTACPRVAVRSGPSSESLHENPFRRSISVRLALRRSARAPGHKTDRVFHLRRALGVPSIAAGEVESHLEKTAKELGKAAATEAMDGGDYDYYRSEDELDPADLMSERTFEMKNEELNGELSDYRDGRPARKREPPVFERAFAQFQFVV